jgi:hypothetical protein
MDWKQHLTATEAERLTYLETAVKAAGLAATDEKRRIYDRCRARARYAASKVAAIKDDQ